MLDERQESILDRYRIIYNVISLNAKNTHAVLCSRTGRVVCFTNWMQTAKQIEKIENCTAWYYIQSERIIPKEVNLNIPFEYAFDPISCALLKKKTEEQEIQHYLLISEKSAALDRLHSTLRTEREHIMSNLPLQDYIHTKKYEEAIRFTESPEHIPPYIQMQCSLTGEDAHIVASKIIHKHQFAQSRLMHTEMIRLKYTKAFLQCEDLTSLNLMLDEMNRETHIYGRM